jgi:GT2 family glycosyltransferase
MPGGRPAAYTASIGGQDAALGGQGDSMVDVAVVIVTFNSAAVIGPLLDSLPAALDGLAATVTVVDNGSTDDTVAVLEGRQECAVVQSTNEGYAAGINRGVAASPPAPAILVLNPDVRMHPRAARTMVEALRRPGTGIVVPRVLDAEETTTRSLRREPNLLRTLGLGFTGRPAFSEYCTDPDDYVRPHVVDWAVGAVLAVSRRCHEALGGWDESFFLYSEETDLSLRARDAGYETWYEPAAVAVHIGHGSGYGDAQHSMLVLNTVRLYHRRHGRVATWAYFGLTALREVLWAARGQRPSRAALRAMFRPRVRPQQLRCNGALLPR